MWTNFLSMAASVVIRVHALVLYLYPVAFRREYAFHMQQLYRDMVRDAVEASGWVGLLRLCARTLFDITRTLLHEHYIAVMELSPRKLAWVGSLAAFYFAALPFLAIASFRINGPDFFAPLVLIGIPACWGIPMMVLGISGRLLPNQRFTSIPYLIVSFVVIAYTILFASRFLVDIEIVRTWGIHTQLLNRIFWFGVALLGGMAVFQKERWLGGMLLGISGTYFLVSFWPKPHYLEGPFVVILAASFIYVGVWLQVKKEQPVSRTYVLSWWTVGIQALILVLAAGAIIASQQRPIERTPAFKMAAGFIPDESIAVYENDAAREAIEDFLGKPLPSSSFDMSMEYKKRETGRYSIHIRFSAKPGEIRELIQSGLLCFKADIEAIPEAQEYQVIYELMQEGKRLEQHTNPYFNAAPWMWARNSSHIRGRCPLPKPYTIEIFQYQFNPESWWVTIWGGG